MKVNLKWKKNYNIIINHKIGDVSFCLRNWYSFASCNVSQQETMKLFIVFQFITNYLIITKYHIYCVDLLINFDAFMIFI